MNLPKTCSDKDLLETFLRRYPHLNYYHLGDLDDFFWPDTRWYISQEQEEIKAVALLYTAVQPVVLLAILNQNLPHLSQLVQDIIPTLPDEVYAHLSPQIESLFLPNFSLQHHGEHHKMTLTKPALLDEIDTSAVITLGENDLPRLEKLYAAAYPGNWFNPRMLQTGQYVGIADPAGGLLCAAGVHVYSPDYRVAALGNITTLPEYRRRGLATSVTAGLCRQLLPSVDTIGLNVRADNPSAIRSYQKAGFTFSGMYNEWMLTRI